MEEQMYKLILVGLVLLFNMSFNLCSDKTGQGFW